MPRSGTSMMMQMLEAAGLEIASDGERPADPDNPRGYYELEAVKRLREDASFLTSAVGRVVKVVAPLLPYLPSDYDYRVVFMERDLDEVLASQRSMLARIGGEQRPAEDAALARAFARQLRQVKIWLADQENIETCFVSHERTLAAPGQEAVVVADFLARCGGLGAAGAGAIAARMAEVVDPALHRYQRKPAP
jgi:hypothetical protein